MQDRILAPDLSPRALDRPDFSVVRRVSGEERRYRSKGSSAATTRTTSRKSGGEKAKSRSSSSARQSGESSATVIYNASRPLPKVVPASTRTEFRRAAAATAFTGESSITTTAATQQVPASASPAVIRRNLTTYDHKTISTRNGDAIFRTTTRRAVSPPPTSSVTRTVLRAASPPARIIREPHHLTPSNGYFNLSNYKLISTEWVTPAKQAPPSRATEWKSLPQSRPLLTSSVRAPSAAPTRILRAPTSREDAKKSPLRQEYDYRPPVEYRPVVEASRSRAAYRGRAPTSASKAPSKSAKRRYTIEQADDEMSLRDIIFAGSHAGPAALPPGLPRIVGRGFCESIPDSLELKSVGGRTVDDHSKYEMPYHYTLARRPKTGGSRSTYCIAC